MAKKFLKYYRFVILVSWLVLKYRILLLILSDRAILHYLTRRFEHLRNLNRETKTAFQKKIVLRRVNTVVNRLYPASTCLVRSSVQNEILMLFGFTDEKIKLGLKLKDEKLLAHAWISANSDFKMIYEL